MDKQQYMEHITELMKQCNDLALLDFVLQLLLKSS